MSRLTRIPSRVLAIAVLFGIYHSYALAEEQEASQVIEEVTVTASKRESSLQDTAMSISVIGSETMLEARLVDMSDYLPSLPSVSFIDFGGGRNTIIVRGLSVDPQLEDKIVSTYFGEANVSQLGNVSGGAAGSANFKMIDIDHVELLRGPQGTLWGAGSMGGTLRILPNKPNLNEFEGSLVFGMSQTHNPGDDNSNGEAVLNFPVINDELAVRLVAYKSSDSGYVRNIAASDPPKVEAAEATGAIVINEDDIGQTDTTGFRASILWNATENLDFSFMYAYQDMTLDGRPEINLNLGPYEQSRWEITNEGSEYLTDEFSMANFVVDWDLGPVTLVSSTSFVNQVSHTDRNFLGEFWEYNPTVVINDIDNDVRIQELRLVSEEYDRFSYVIGYYYEDFVQDRDDITRWLGTVETNIFDPNGSNELGSFDDHEEITQNAIFGELNYRFAEDWSVTAGARYFDYTKDFFEVFPIKGVFNIGLPEPDIRHAEEDGTTFKLGVDYQLNSDVLLYAQWAEGFRLGDYLQPWPDTCDADGDGLHDELGLPRTTSIDSDSTDNYEFGIKWWDSRGKFSLNAAVFRTDWSGIPIRLGGDSECGFGVVLNGGEARTQGVEVEGAIQVSDSFRIGYGASFTDAELRTPVESVGEPGDRLPGSPEFSAHIGGLYEFDLLERSSFVRADYTYVGGYYGAVGEQGAEAGDYSLINLTAGSHLSDELLLDVYVKNLTNDDSLVWVDFFPPNGVRQRPRTIGFDLRYRF